MNGYIIRGTIASAALAGGSFYWYYKNLLPLTSLDSLPSNSLLRNTVTKKGLTSTPYLDYFVFRIPKEKLRDEYRGLNEKDLTNQYLKSFFTSRLFQLEDGLLQLLGVAKKSTADDYKFNVNNTIGPFTVVERNQTEILNSWDFDGIG
ncbi:hypothetical protein HDV02_000885, partial [Globomyces sp. JEL0801]